MLESFGVINIWTYIAGLVVIILAPGPNSLYVLKTGSTLGFNAGYRAASGVLIGDAILILLSYLGVASLIQTSPILFTIIRYLGAIYLLYLGGSLIYSNWIAKKGHSSSPKVKQERVFRKSLMLSLTNPKAILFYVSFFIQFIDFNYEHTWISYSILAVILEVVSFTYLTMLILIGSSLSRYFRQNQTMAKAGNSLLGLIFMGFAARLAAIN
ncbi:leucine efflux protein LeuE [Neptunomonas phycophila]|uniref:Leucine efflux protein LeuE n=2 Tax=Neptunomonas phycophila TaxID=1572645 RepID=A0AAW7XFH9_9GAMM|nr:MULTISPECIES: leucine efflux protein LeuE [Neptunomonas]MBT3146991.1 leucine efflux protein LeuE [Neptunomonas phycophila]MDN2658657.1 leucine efflux protein LeuE [Neptunomonas sp. CHC150]MDO6452780.1 leucine efflux protein LeuE [Neptunomonas phycophila]MDO6467566.1 leucine efflux protein LeuE [Neptunomonas phycophila]MDO6783552.1 leucine efflux protein LeuE [Neptunomonas phycophila]